MFLLLRKSLFFLLVFSVRWLQTRKAATSDCDLSCFLYSSHATKVARSHTHTYSFRITHTNIETLALKNTRSLTHKDTDSLPNTLTHTQNIRLLSR